MTTHNHDHANPYHESDRDEATNKAMAERVDKMEALLLEKGLVSQGALDKLADIYENDLGPMNGAKVVARAWVDPDFKKRLLEDATSAIAELGFGGLQGEHMVAKENTSDVHNVVVCTLCSCYPWPVLGLAPCWYKSFAYRSKVVIEPREVLKNLVLTLPDDVEVRVWDSSAEIRYLVIPERPEGTENLNESELAEIIERDSMIGVTKVSAAMKEERKAKSEIAEMSGSAALPRKSGEMVFHDDWERKSFTLAVSLSEQGLFEWHEFQSELISAIKEAEGDDPNHPSRGYFESWQASLESLLAKKLA